jgi:hypothetical protein
MFLTKDDLKLAYGVDIKIAQQFVDREVPIGNLYWENRKIYLPGAPGYIFMPLFFDVLFRCGADKDLILADGFFHLSESILNSAAHLEHNKIDWYTHLGDVCNLIKPYVKREELFYEIKKYLESHPLVKHGGSRLGTNYPSLNRADTYLFLVSCIPHGRFNEDKAIKGWYALITYFLILDDLADIKEDLKSGEQNVLMDAGLNQNGLSIISSMIDNSHNEMMLINPVMANRIDHKREVMDLQQLLKSITSSD